MGTAVDDDEGVNTLSFHDLLRQLEKVHDAEIARLTESSEDPSRNEQVGETGRSTFLPLLRATEGFGRYEPGNETGRSTVRATAEATSTKKVVKKKKKIKKHADKNTATAEEQDDGNIDEEAEPKILPPPTKKLKKKAKKAKPAEDAEEAQKPQTEIPDDTDVGDDDYDEAHLRMDMMIAAESRKEGDDEVTRNQSAPIAKTQSFGNTQSMGVKGAKSLRYNSTQEQRLFNKKVIEAKMGEWEEEDPEPEPLKYNTYQRYCYVADAWLSMRRWQTATLIACIFATVFISGLIWTIFFSDEELSVIDNALEGFWIAWTYMADPGTHGGEETQGRRLISSGIAVMGILLMSMMMAMIIDVFQEKMESLRQGKAMVVERGHTLIFGWNEKAVLIIEELCTSNSSDGGGVIVVMSGIPKPEIEREFGLRFPVKKRLGTKIVFRTGNPMVTSDLMKVGAPTAKASIVLSNDGDPDNSDQETLRVVLALKTLPYTLLGHIVAELRDVDNEPVVRMVGGDAVETLVCHDVLGRLMLCAARQPGLGKVYESLFGFQGDEFYMSEWPQLEGESFGSLIERFPDAVPIGVFTKEHELILNPPNYRRMKPGEQIFVIAEDDDTYWPQEPEDVELGKIKDLPEYVPSTEKILLCGWRRDIRDIVECLDRIVEKGSELHMITSFIPVKSRTKVLLDDGLDVNHLQRLKLVHHFGTPSVRRRLGALPLSEYSSCMIFADQEFEQDTMKADSHSLAALLLLRDLRKEQAGQNLDTTTTDQARLELDEDHLTVCKRNCPAICEVLDPRTQKTIGANNYVKRSADFCQTNKIAAQILAMVGENRSVKILFDELLGVSGNTVHVYTPNRYAETGENVSFWTLAKRASVRHETLFGYIYKGDMSVILNPPYKNERNVWDHYDMVVIAASHM